MYKNNRRKLAASAITLLMILGILSSISPAAAQTGFADPAFYSVWQRTDLPVQNGSATRSWYWGPQPNTAGLYEPYAQGVNGQHLVQYFDKSRMEINNPNADRNSKFYVTNGLLTTELVSGKLQLGDNTFQQYSPAEIPVSGDPDDAGAPTYATFTSFTGPAADRRGQNVIDTIDRFGGLGLDQNKANLPGTRNVYFDTTTRHNIPEVMWNFLNASGPVGGGGQSERLNDPWFYASGLPISEPYWTKVKIAGVSGLDVMIQLYERRVLTYVPANPPGFKVEMGNIGQHYYKWRYQLIGASTPVVNTPVPGTPAASPTATAGAQPTATPQPGPLAGVIVFTSNQYTDTTKSQVYAMKPTGSSRVNLTNDNSVNKDPVWSPDGSKIAFISNRSGEFKLYIMNKDGSNPILLNNNYPGRQSKPSWSPDGQKIAFIGFEEAYGAEEIFSTDIFVGADPVRLTGNTSFDADPSWSPDATQIAFVSNRDGAKSIYVMNADGTNVRRVTNPGIGNANILPRWSPQGSRIIYVGGPDGSAAGLELYLVKVDGSNNQRLTNNSSNDWDPAFSSDGGRIAYAREQGTSGRLQLFRARADNSELVPIVQNSFSDSQPDWFSK